MKKGFTLIEIMVAVSIFVIVATIVAGALVTASETNRKAQAIRLAMDNLSFAMESMVINIKEGQGYICRQVLTVGMINKISDEVTHSGVQCSNNNPGSALKFKSTREGVSAASDNIIYGLQGSSKSIVMVREGSSQTISLTSPDIQIDRLDFKVFNVPTGNSVGDRVAIVIEGVTTDKTSTAFRLQTTVAPLDDVK